MTRNKHDMVNDHFGSVSDAQLASGTPASGDAPLSNGDGTRTWGPAAGFVPVVAYAECNSPINTGATPGDSTDQPFDTFYDIGFNVIGSLPAGIGLTYSSGIFTTTETGVWALHVGADIVASPGSTGRLLLATPNYGYSPVDPIAASGNPTTWVASITIVAESGATFSLRQSSTGTNVDIVDGYAALDIIRIAGTAS